MTFVMAFEPVFSIRRQRLIPLSLTLRMRYVIPLILRRIRFQTKVDIREIEYDQSDSRFCGCTYPCRASRCDAFTGEPAEEYLNIRKVRRAGSRLPAKRSECLPY